VRALVGLEAGRIQEQVREGAVTERAIAELLDLLIELATDALVDRRSSRAPLRWVTRSALRS